MSSEGGDAEEASPPPVIGDIAAPPAVSSQPDKDTKKAFTHGDAPKQVFHFKMGGFNYGTDDKGHAAAIILASAILVIILICLLAGSFVDRTWIGETLKMLGNAFLIVAGIAVGKSVDKTKSDD